MYSSQHRWAFVLAVVIAGAILALLGAGCAGPITVACHDRGAPYTHERPTQPFSVTIANSRGVDSWTADGAPTVLTVHNPTDERRTVHVVCEPSVPPTYIDFGHIEGYFCMPPHSEKIRLVEFMNVDAMTQVCRVADAYVDVGCAS